MLAKKLMPVLAVLSILALVLTSCTAVQTTAAGGAAAGAAAAAPAADGKWCADTKIRFFAGGEAGDAFASIVYKGAQEAQKDTGANVEYVFSGWQVEKMVQQLREAIAAKPDGIAMMGHPGDDALLPLAEEAQKAGILMMYQNVDVPKVREQFGGGYVGANLAPQGEALGKEAVKRFGLKQGDQAIVYGAWGQPGRFIREEGTAKALEDAGLKVERIVAPPEWSTDPNQMIPNLSAALLKLPDTKLIVYPGGQLLGAVPSFMEALKKKPGDVVNIGFDTSPAVIDGFSKGYVQLTADQQPFLQGYMPILSLCLTKKYGLAPMNLDTGAGFVDAQNYQSVADWATKGYR